MHAFKEWLHWLLLQRCLCAALAGLVGVAAFPPIGAWFLSLVSTAFLLWLIRDQEWVRAGLIGLTYGGVYALGCAWWFLLVVGPLMVPLIGLFALYFALLAGLIGLTRGQHVVLRIVLTAVFAVAIDWLRGDAWYLRFPCYDFDAPEIAADLVRRGATVLVCPTYDAMHWSTTQHVHHELLLRLRAVENDRWLVRTASSGRSESIDPRGRPSAAGVEIGQRGQAVVPYGHRQTRPPGGRLHLLGPLAGLGTLLAVGPLSFVTWQRRRIERAAFAEEGWKPMNPFEE